jgi:RNA polymerase sigma-70 factor (ECF subfamily)
MTCNIAMTAHNLLDLAQRTAQRLARLPQDVDDITQNALVKLVAKPKNFFAAIHSPAYVHATVHNACIDYYRKENRQRLLFDRCATFDCCVAEPVAESYNGSSDPVPLNELSPEHKQVLELLACGLSYKQIADITKVSAGTVRSRIFSARRQMKKRLAESQ